MSTKLATPGTDKPKSYLTPNLTTIRGGPDYAAWLDVVRAEGCHGTLAGMVEIAIQRYAQSLGVKDRQPRRCPPVGASASLTAAERTARASKGGAARAAKLTPAERSAIAKMGADAKRPKTK